MYYEKSVPVPATNQVLRKFVDVCDTEVSMIITRAAIVRRLYSEQTAPATLK